MSKLSKRLADLSPEQVQLLAHRLALRSRGRASASGAIPRRPRHERAVAPLSYAQERLWFLHQLEPEGCAFNISQAVRLNGALDLAALRRSLDEITRRHETLRTTFRVSDGRPVQVIAPEANPHVSFFDLGELPPGRREAEAERLLASEARRPFDLSEGPLVRLVLARTGGDEEHVALLTMHHIVSDGWSMGVLVRELGALYAAFSAGRPSPLEELPVQYADFTLWQRERLTGEAREALLAYWRRQLGGELPVLELPTDGTRGAAPTFGGAVQTFAFPADLSERLRALSREDGATLFMTLLAAFQILLQRYTGQNDIVVGSNIANRNRREIEGLIGFFINNLVLRTDLSGNPTFRELLARVREVTLGAYAHQDLPFETLVEALDLRRRSGSTPLFQVMFVFQNAPAAALQLPGLTLSPLRLDDGQSAFDLTLFIGDASGGPLSGAVEYNTELFNPSTIGRMVERFLHLLRDIAADAGREIGSLSMDSEAEGRDLIFTFNDDLS